MADHIESSPGQIVVVRSDPSLRRGRAVMEVLPGEVEARVKVFVDGKVRTYYASQLQVEAQSDENVQSLSCEQFHASLTELQIRRPGRPPCIRSTRRASISFPTSSGPCCASSGRIARVSAVRSRTRKWFTHWNGATPSGSTH